MNKKQNQRAAATVALRLWTHAQAMKAVPYLRAVMGSIREQWLELRGAQLQAARIDARPGRPSRQELFMRERLDRQRYAQEQLEEDLKELMDLDVYIIDPARGFAQIPYAQGKQLAWYVFDLFDFKGLVAWRFDTDSPETRRPLGETSKAASRAVVNRQRRK